MEKIWKNKSVKEDVYPERPRRMGHTTFRIHVDHRRNNHESNQQMPNNDLK